MARRSNILALLASALGLGGLMYAFSDVAHMQSATDYRARVVEAARSEIGRADLDKYFADAAPQYLGSRPQWCGIFALWCIRQAGLAPDIRWIVSKGFLFRLPQTSNPKPGDIMYVDEPYRHEAVVLAVRGDMVDLANGNGAGGVVSLSTAPKSKGVFFSIQPFIDAAEGAKAQ